MKQRPAQEPETSQAESLTRISLILVGIAVGGWLLQFVVSIVLARNLGPQDYREYAVAIAMLALAGTFCELGTGKYAMRILPEYARKKRWSLAKGYYWFSASTVTLASMIGIVAGMWMTGGFALNGDQWSPARLALVFLPVTALVAVAAEFLMAEQKPFQGSLITAVICPGATLCLFLAFQKMQCPADSMLAVTCYGLADVAGLLWALVLLKRHAGPGMTGARPVVLPRKWLRWSIWFSLLAFVASWMPRLSLLAMDAIEPSAIEIARFAAALEISGFVLLVRKSTNKYYMPELSLIMTDQQWQLARIMARQRLVLIGSISATFLIGVLLFGKQMLGWFGPVFSEGYTALCFMTAGTCVATIFSMAPEFLKFAGKLKTVLATYCLAGVLLTVLTVVLGSRYGASGAGFAFGFVFAATAIVFRVLASRQLDSNS